MKKPVSDTYLAAVFAAVVGAIFTWAGSDFWADLKPLIGIPLVNLLRILAFLGFAGFSFAVLHYFGVLGAGAEPAGTRERSDYDALRHRIASGNWVAREYARRLEVLLNSVDRFFGDAGMAERTLFPHAFGLCKPAPLWTASAFERCLLLALIYPVTAIILIWVVTNHVGPAENALGLQTLNYFRRVAILVAVGFLGFITWRTSARTRQTTARAWHTSAWALLAGSIAGAGVFLAAVIVGGAGTAASVITLLAVLAFGGFAEGYTAILYALCIGIVANQGATLASSRDLTNTEFLASTATLGAMLAGALILVTAIEVAIERSKKRGWEGTFLCILVPVTILVFVSGAGLLSHLSGWREIGSLLLFLGLLTFLNAPFDWVSLGLTRALMRRGLEREKWWPYYYATIDALVAALVIALLALVMVAGVQLFDDLALYGGGISIMPPMRDFLDAIESNPGKPEYWWVYATLFSTMLPSLINLFIAGVSLARGVPGVSSWLLSKVRDGEAVPAYDRLLVAIVLALQGVAGLTFAIVAQGFLFWVIIWQGMPRLGIGVLDLAYLVAH